MTLPKPFVDKKEISIAIEGGGWLHIEHSYQVFDADETFVVVVQFANELFVIEQLGSVPMMHKSRFPVLLTLDVVRY